jgi:hypothetical protein
MDHESIMLYLSRKHLSAVAIHAKIDSVLGGGTIGYGYRVNGLLGFYLLTSGVSRYWYGDYF